MNNICLALYSDSGKGITARSLDMIDIEEAMAENWGKRKGFSSNYGKTYTPSSNYVPNCYTTANIISQQNQQNNDLRPGSSSATGYTQRSGFTCKYTYYYIRSEIGSTRQTILGSRNSWLASRGVGAYSKVASFIIRYLDSGYFLSGSKVFNSNNTSDTDSYGLSPLASLGSSVQLQKLDDNIWKVQ